MGKTRVVIIIAAVCLMMLVPNITHNRDSFAQSETERLAKITPEILIPPLFYNSTWKISNADGVADWSPTEDILVVSTWGGFEPKVMLYGANGTKLMTIAEFKQGEFVGPALFSPNGSKIAFTHTMPPSSSSQLEIFDLKTKAIQNIQFQGNFTYFDWMPDGNHIIYLTSDPNMPNQFPYAYQLRIHDLRTGSETVIQDSLTNVESLDLSQDGTTLLLVKRVTVQQPCEISIDGICHTDEIITLKLGQGKDSPNYDSTDSQSEMIDNNTRIISSKVIWKGTPPYSIAFPRWVLNDSAIIYSKFYYRCGGPMIAISPDGTRNQTLSSAENSLSGACEENGGVINRDGTIIAYAKSEGISATPDFHPINSGLYLTFTESCESKRCTPPIDTIPLIKVHPQMTAQPVNQSGALPYTVFLSIGYEEMSFGPKIDENTKTLSMMLHGPKAGDRIGERDVLLYLPSSLIDGDMVVFINGTRFYPSSTEESKDCLSTQTEEFCSKIKADIDKIEGWSIVNITDDTTDHRSAVSIEIVGTTVTPEFALGMPLLIIASITVASISFVRFKMK